MATRGGNPRISITGDASGVTRATKQGEDSLESFGKKANEASDRAAEGFKKIHEASKLLLEIGGLSSLAFGLKDVTEEAVNAETEQKKLQATVKTAGLSWKAHGKEIDDWLDKTSRASGFVKSDLTSSLSNLIRVTGSVTKARKLESEAMDVSRARGTSLATAQQLLARVYAGSFTSLQRLGIPVKAVTTAQDKLKASTKNASDEQIKHAKALDAASTRTEALRLVQEKFGGQSKAFASSTAGSFDRAKASLDLFEEQAGKVVLPLMAKAASAIANVATVTSKDWPQIEKVISTVVGTVKTKVTGWITKNRADIDSVIKAFKTFGAAVTVVFEKVVLPIVKRDITAVGKVLGDVVDVVRGVVRLISGLLSGNWSKAWDGAKEAAGGAVRGIETIVKTTAQNLWTIIKGLGPKLVHGIVSGLENLGKALATGIVNGVKAAVKAVPGMIGGLLKGLGHAITHGIGSAIGAINPFGDGLGVSPGSGLTLPAIGGFGGGLDGANAFMRPFAALGSSMGLQLTAGRDHHGTTTISGNTSYHALGDAIDEAGPTQSMYRYAKTLYSKYGSRLRELISPWPQFNIKDGHPYRYPANVEAEHSGANSHVHVAYMPSGDGHGLKPRTGDGIGQIENLWTKEGGDPRYQAMAAAIAMAESSGNPSITHRNSDGSIDRGLWQINSTHGSLSTTNPARNAKAAISISHDGRDWSAWTTYTSGAYRKYLTAAAKAVKHAKVKTVKPGIFAAPGSGKTSGQTHYAAPSASPTLDFQNTQHAASTRTGPAKGNTVRKGNTPDQQQFLSSLADSSSSGGGGDDALTQAIQENTAAIQAQTEIDTQIATNQLAILALTNQGPSIIAATVAAVSGGIGGKVGLGFQAAGVPGQLARY